MVIRKGEMVIRGWGRGAKRPALPPKMCARALFLDVHQKKKKKVFQLLLLSRSYKEDP